MSRRTNTMHPLLNLLRASAWDAANRQMRKAGRSKWGRADYDLACDVQERLTRGFFGRDSDADDHMSFIRFQIAEQWERAGRIGLGSDWPAVLTEIETMLSASPSVEG